MQPVHDNDVVELPASQIRASPSEKIKSKKEALKAIVKEVVKEVKVVDITSQETPKANNLLKKDRTAIDAEDALPVDHGNEGENEELVT
jgi:hypothetical protein